MRAHVASSWILLLIAAVAPFASAQAPAVASGEADAPLRIDIVGASVSAGFADGPMTGGSADNRTVPLQKVLRGWLEETPVRVQSRADLAMFLDAEGRGLAQIERCAKNPPDLLVAIDFLFWFGYGYVDADRKDGKAETAARQQRLAAGLELLDRLQCPMIIGDLPDVHGAAQRMISPRQIPPVEILEQLNATLLAWAKARPRVHVFPLRELVAQMKEKGVVLPLADGPLATPPAGLMQGDRLHATRVGMAWVGYLLQDHIAATVPTGHAGLLPHRTFEEFVRAASAGTDLEELRGKSASKAAAGAGKGN